MPSYKQLKAQLAHLSRLYLAFHGPYSLSPRRAEPMKHSMMVRMATLSGVRIGTFVYDDGNHDAFMFRRLVAVLWFTAFRLGEIVYHASGEVMFLTFESLSWSIAGVIVLHPTPAQLRSMRPGVDYARLAPPRAKPDQWGEIHCPFPAVITLHDEPGNAAAALRDLELRCNVAPEERSTTALFHDAERKPYTHAFLDRLLKSVLAFLFGAAVATIFTWHSFRSGLATALHAAGVPDAMIQLICRWMCPESLHVYRRMGTAEHEQHIRRAMAADVDVIQSSNVPRVAADQGYAQLGLTGASPTDAALHRDFEVAFAAAHTVAPAEPPNASPSPSPGPAPPPILQPLHTVRQGMQVVVAVSKWPRYKCTDNGGKGWTATVVSHTSVTAVVNFTHAVTRDGRPYVDCRLPLDALFTV